MLTSVPGSVVPEVGIPNIDKVVHFLLYGVLGLLMARALKRDAYTRPGTRRPTSGSLVTALLVIGLFAAADEWHQRWIPGRSSDVSDWYADMAGATFALLLAVRPRARRDYPT